MSKTRSSVSVIVVGAGMAGLSAASSLLQAGFSNVTILEASNRYGGRIKSVKMSKDEDALELGASCIHGGSLENPLYKLATEWGITDSLTVLDRIPGQFRGENGEEFEKEIIKKTWELYLQMEEDMNKIYIDRKETDPVPDSISVAQFVKQTRPKILEHFPEGVKRETADKVFNTMLNYCQFMNGDELDLVSADKSGHFKTIPGKDMLFKGEGYTQFVEELMKRIPWNDLICFNSEVTQICWGGELVDVKCKNGKSYKADHVIVTCSLGHLKANYGKMFNPPLPESKASAIQRIGFGRVNKLFLQYDQPFWTEGIKLVWSEHGRPVTDTSDWVSQVFCFNQLARNSKAIGGPFGGKGAEILESLTDDEVATVCTDLLRKFLDDPSIPKPVEVLRSNWISDPLYRGSYSYMSMESRDNDIPDLAAPLPDEQHPTLMFAGEATHPDYYSTVHGAYLTGVRESHRLAELYKK